MKSSTTSVTGSTSPVEMTSSVKRNGELHSSDEFKVATDGTTSPPDSLSIGDGELLVLMDSENSEEESALPIPKQLEVALLNELNEILAKSHNIDDSHKELSSSTPMIETEKSPYGHPLSIDEAKRMMPEGTDGRTWFATVIPNEFITKNGSVVKGINRHDIDTDNKCIKPRRATVPITQNDLFSSITKVSSEQRIGFKSRPRYIFYGILNGWPSLNCFELISIERKSKLQWQKVWIDEEHGSKNIEPQQCLKDDKVYRVKLRGAPWTEYGWSYDSLGFAFWYEAQNKNCPKVLYGEKMIAALEDKDALCTAIHMISHRYGGKVKRETARDLLTYHSVCLLEWDHGEYCTVTEAAYLNGMGGYRGRSNWYDDKDAPISNLYKVLPAEMISPWDTHSAEIRCYDVTVKTLDEFKQYIAKYTTKYGCANSRFIDPQYTFSHAARLSFRTKSHIAQYLVNYIMRDSQYAELKRNCQTFCADLCVLIAGKKNIQPFHPVIRFDYQNRTHLFLYDHKLYNNSTTTNQKAKKKKK
jgi:hypothetical protein